MRALGTELQLIAALAMRLTRQFEEAAGAEGIVAGATHEMLGVISTTKCLHAFFINGLTAVVADAARFGAIARGQIAKVLRDGAHELVETTVETFTALRASGWRCVGGRRRERGHQRIQII